MVKQLRGLVALVVVPVFCGCGGGNTAGELVKVPEFKPAGQTKCRVGTSQTRPLIVEWPAADRGALEVQKNRGLVAVRYAGCEMEVLRQCTAPGAYGYTPVTPKQDAIRIRDEDELYAAIPVYAAKFEGKLKTAGQLSVDMTIVGSYDADRHTVRKDELEGDCAKATHFISAITAGAFEFAAGGSAEVGAKVDVMGAGAGAKSEADRELLNRDGYKKACEEATGEDEQPPEGCGALLRVEVVKLGRAQQKAAEPGEDAPPVVADEGPPIGPGVVKVHIDADELVQLIRLGPAIATQVPVQQQGGGTVMQTQMVPARELVCVSPCDAWVDGSKGHQFLVAGDGIPDSEMFRLHDKEGNVNLAVDPGSGGGMVAGVYLTIGGISFVAAGGAFMAVSQLGGTTNETFLISGGVALGAGVLMAAIGIPLWATSGTDMEMAAARRLLPHVADNGALQWAF